MRTERLRQILEDRILLHGCYQRLFETEDGKIILRHIIKNSFVLKSTFVAGDTAQTAMNEGTRRLALSILRFAKKSPREIMNQLEEGLQNE